MPVPRRFSSQLVTSLHEGRGLKIRAGRTHRFIGIWVVVVEDRVFVRSWSVKTRGWYRTFLQNGQGEIQLGKRTIPVLAVPTRSTRLQDAVDQAYLEKYATPGALKYAKDLGSPRSRATTLELRPALLPRPRWAAADNR